MEVFDEDLGEDVDGCERAQRDGAVARPHHVDPEDARQVGRAHLVDHALLGHLWRRPEGGTPRQDRAEQDGRCRDTFQTDSRFNVTSCRNPKRKWVTAK